jgi:hypothetical protein
MAARKPSPWDLLVVVGSEHEPGRYYEIKRNRMTQVLGCSCTSFAMAPTCNACGKLLSRRHEDDRTLYDCRLCSLFDVPKSCKHLRHFSAGAGKPAPVAVAEAMLTAVAARRQSSRNTAVSMTATIKQPIALDQPVRAIILPDD